MDKLSATELVMERTSKSWGAFAPALASRNFRLLWVGQAFSSTGTNLQFMAESWLIYNLTGSTFMLGVLGVFSLLPVVPILFAGSLLIDRVPRRKLIMATQLGLILQSAVFSALVFSGRIEVWHILVLNFFGGGLAAIDQPARQAFLSELVSPQDLPNAIALNASTFNLSRVLGFALSGLLIATVGAGGTFLVNALLTLAPVLALSLMHIKDRAQDTKQNSLGVALTEGIAAYWRNPALLGALSLVAVVMGLAWPVYGMMPAFAQNILNTGPIGLGLLMSTNGLGALIGTYIVVRLGSARRGHWLMLVSLLVPVLVVGFAVSNSLITACLMALLLGIAMLMLYTLTTSLIQVNVADRVKGRVMAILSLTTGGTFNLGVLIVGGLAEPLGLPLMLVLAAGVALVYAVGLNLVLPSVRRLD